MPDSIDRLSLEKLQKFGTTFKKAEYIKSVAQKIRTKEFDINSLHTLSDEDVCAFPGYTILACGLPKC